MSSWQWVTPLLGIQWQRRAGMWGSKTCNGAGNAEGPGRARSTASVCSGQQEVGRAPGVSPGRSHMPDTRSACLPAMLSQKILPCRYFPEQEEVSEHHRAEQGGRRKVRNTMGKCHCSEMQIQTSPRPAFSALFQKTSLKRSYRIVLAAEPICSFRHESPGREKEGTSRSAVLPR